MPHLILFEMVYVFLNIIYMHLKLVTFSSKHLSVCNFVDNIKWTISNGWSVNLAIYLHHCHKVPVLKMIGAKPPFSHVSSCRSAQLNTGMSLYLLPLIRKQSKHTPVNVTSTVTSPAAKDVRTLIALPRRLLWYPCVGLATDRETELCKVTFQDLIHLCMVTPYAWKIRSLIDLHFWCSG